jgi:hypothetical protein
MGGNDEQRAGLRESSGEQAPATKALLNIVVLLAVVLPLVIVPRF